MINIYYLPYNIISIIIIILISRTLKFTGQILSIKTILFIQQFSLSTIVLLLLLFRKTLLAIFLLNFQLSIFLILWLLLFFESKIVPRLINITTICSIIFTLQILIYILIIIIILVDRSLSHIHARLFLLCYGNSLYSMAFILNGILIVIIPTIHHH